MSRITGVFQRVEQKYLLTDAQYTTLWDVLQPYMKPDAYGRSTVCSIYFDTPDRRLVRTSLEKPVYKEKLRLRTYGVPKPDSPAFDEAIRWRVEDVDLLHGDGGAQLLPDGVRLMEIKAVGGMPGWLADALGELHIYPKIARFAAVLLTLLLAGCSSVQPAAQTDASPAPESSTSDVTETESEAETETVSVSTSGPIDEASLTLKKKDEYTDYTGAVEVDLSNPADAAGVSVSGSVITITADGTYVLTGTLADGQIIVDAGDAADVRLVLENAALSSSDSAPIYAKNADKVILSLPEGTESRITDSVTGKDSVQIFDGTIDITAQGDGIKSTKAEEDKGFVYIGGGVLTVDAGCDGIQAETSALISGGELNITTGGGSANAAVKTGNDRFIGWQNSASDTDAPSEKGVKAQTYLEITGGTLTLDTTDDSIHCNDTIMVSGGTITAQSGDDGLHADSYLEISNGSFTVLKSYEGIEASEIVVNGGEIDVAAQDDGFNAAGGADGSSMDGRPGQNAFAGDASKSLTFNDGTVTVDAGGDGLDSNGTLAINGGTICVSGPTDSANGTFDSGTGFTVNGGVLLGAGSAGMMETPGGDSAQNVVIVSGSGQAGSMVEIRDAAGSVLFSWTVPKSFSVVTFSMPEITVGETYAVYVDGTQAASAECTGVVTGGAGGMAGGFDRGGGKGGFMDPGAQKPGGVPEKPSAAGGLFGVGKAQ